MLNKLRVNFEKLLLQAKEDISVGFPYLPFTVKVHETKSNWIAQFRNGSVVRGGRAIIWISDQFPELIFNLEKDEYFDYSDLEKSALFQLKVTIGHELIHGVQEALHFKKTNRLMGVDFNEYVAEFLGRRLAHGESINNDSLITDFLALCCEDVGK